MIICPNCTHANPEGATQCEACYTPLPEIVAVAPDADQPPPPNEVNNEAFSVPLGGDPIAVMFSLSQNAMSNHASFSEGAQSASESRSTPVSVVANSPKTQIQQFSARLLHIQTNTLLEMPDHLSTIRIGKPNNLAQPDIDVSGFANSDIVSRVHANIRVEGGIYYLEDMGSSNGTYVNNLPLKVGDRCRLRAGDRIALGKGDKVSFLFQLS
jgi:hypothetical protein